MVQDNDLLRKILKNQIKKKVHIKNSIKNYEEPREKLFELIKRTITFGESNSLLLIGPPGSGKTFLIENIIEELNTCVEFEKQFCVVRLNGLIQTDDKLALKVIIKQLLLEIDVEDAYATRSFAENLQFVLECFKNKNNKSIIFILDEFDLFCLHHNQTLLYNLFDVAQSSQSPIFVIGLTCNMSVIELLEKRVRSRFSHRKITLFPSVEDRINDLILSENNKDLTVKRIREWNKYVQDIINSTNVQKYLKLFLELTRNHNDFTNILFEFISLIDNNKPWPLASDLIDLLNAYYNEDSRMNLLMGFSVLEICLLIAIKHHWEIYDGQPFNFKMIYTRYSKFANNSTGIQIEPRKVAVKAFQHIVQLEFIVPITGQMQFEHQMFKLVLTFDQITNTIKKFNDLPTSVVQWASSLVV